MPTARTVSRQSDVITSSVNPVDTLNRELTSLAPDAKSAATDSDSGNKPPIVVSTVRTIGAI